MAINRHEGEQSPTFVIEVSPEKYRRLIDSHGVVARIMQARLCPCSARNAGQPDLYCLLCNGEGYQYKFQRKFLKADEDSDLEPLGRNKVRPFRIPIIEPIRVERTIAPEQGGIVSYTIKRWDSTEIEIEGSPLPEPWMKMRVSYYFDGYNLISAERVDVHPATRTLVVNGTRWNNGYRTSNVENAHGSIAVLVRVWDAVTGHEFTQCRFNRNEIYLSQQDPVPVPGNVRATYYYAPVTKVLLNEPETTTTNQEAWMSMLREGVNRAAIEGWYDVAQGDLITLLTPELFRDDVIVRSGMHLVDKLSEFDVSRLDDEAVDEDGNRYFAGRDYLLRGYHDLEWIGAQPAPGKAYSLRFAFRPTYVVFQTSAVPNSMENKKLPQIVNLKYFSQKNANTMRAKTDAPIYMPGTGMAFPV